MRKITRMQVIFVLNFLLLFGLGTVMQAQSTKSYFPIGGVTRYSNGTYYFAMSGRHYQTPGEVVTKSGEVTNCKTNKKKCAEILSQAARESIEMDGLQMTDPSSFVGSAPILDLVTEYDASLAELGEDKPGIYFFDYRDEEWQAMKFFKESHTRVMKSLKRSK